MVQTKTSELTQKLLNGKSIRLTFHYHTKEISRFINSLLVKVLSNNDMSYLQTVVETITREMILNAVKANSKRVFFRKVDLNIEDKDQYKAGMEQFKNFIVSEQNKLIRDLKEGGYTVDLIMKKGPEGFLRLFGLPSRIHSTKFSVLCSHLPQLSGTNQHCLLASGHWFNTRFIA